MSHDAIRYWNFSDLTGDAVVVLPIAATEQHGPHLPFTTDVDIGYGLLNEAFKVLQTDYPVWSLPMQTVGVSLEHARFDGTKTVGADEMVETIYQLGSKVAQTGVRRLVISNSHGGNHAAVDTAALRLRLEQNLLVVKAHYYEFPIPLDIKLPAHEWLHGIHGGAVETALMMHLCPTAVRLEHLQSFTSFGERLEEEGFVIGPTGPTAFAWLSGDLNRNGAIGNATLANAELGRQLTDYYGHFLATVIRDAHRFPISQLLKS